MKKVLALFFLLPFSGITQIDTPQVFSALGIFYEDEFKHSRNTYLQLSAGVELFSYKFIVPEIDVSYYTGTDQDERSDFNDMFVINYRSLLHRNANAVVWGFAPKLFYGDEEFRLVFIPKWNFGKVSSAGSFIDSDDNSVEQKASSKINFWAFSLGIEGEAWENAPNIGFYLTYNGFNAGKALNQLDFKNLGYRKKKYNTKAIGLALRVSFDFKKN